MGGSHAAASKLKREKHCRPFYTIGTQGKVSALRNRLKRTLIISETQVLLATFERSRIIGNPINKQKMRCGFGLFNEALKFSHLYGEIRNNNYSTGKQFLYPGTFR